MATSGMTPLSYDRSFLTRPDPVIGWDTTQRKHLVFGPRPSRRRPPLWGGGGGRGNWRRSLAHGKWGNKKRRRLSSRHTIV